MSGVEFGEMLRDLRRGGGLSQEDLAEASGSSVRTIRELERGRVRTPHRRTVQVMADALQLSDAQRGQFLALARKERFAGADIRAARTRAPATVAPSGAATRHHASTTGEPESGPRRSTGDQDGQVDQPVRIPRQLPAEVPVLIGREKESSAIHRLSEQITAGPGRSTSLVIVHGPPGVGKTSLVIAVAHQISSRFPDGQLFADLRGMSATGPTPVADVLAELLRSLAVPDAAIPPPGAARDGLLRTLLRDRRVLIVLDNAFDEAQVRALVPANARSMVLVTCRRPLSGLDATERLRLDVLSRTDARRMLGALIGRRRADADPSGVDRLVQLCGRLPLALRVAGNRLASRRDWSVRQLVDRLHGQPHRLSLLTAGDLDVRAAFTVSYRQLRPLTAAVFRSAAVIAGADFDAALAAAAAGVHVDEATVACEELLDAGLLQSAADRYSFHDLVRLFAAERLDDEAAPGRGPAHERAVRWLLAHTQRAALTFRADATADSYRRDARAWLEREAPNRPMAVRDAARHGWHTDVVQVTKTRDRYFDATTQHHPAGSPPAGSGPVRVGAQDQGVPHPRR
ncbi:NB-ARC domain-containing protein [Actinoplanes xinjiangensis]|uniref:NB-ARC domain-containing protein n=1 Tax=Actinoplanes xinjiangensis TaxID=512350 RepID=A0A316FDK5_9ACTN|nr:NB-ARC domain-containing protein [Actinoplanes xinjiangensis]GIF40113.1 hypothetical protein Axi01nite_44240 [Actinoplanes xinjiangensis]